MTTTMTNTSVAVDVRFYRLLRYLTPISPLELRFFSDLALDPYVSRTITLMGG